MEREVGDIPASTLTELNCVIAQQRRMIESIRPFLASIRAEGRAHQLIESLGTPHVLTGWLRDWLTSRRGRGECVVDQLQIATSGRGWATTSQASQYQQYTPGVGYLAQAPYTIGYMQHMGAYYSPYNYILPPATRNECILRINRKPNFWCLGEDPGNEVHVVVSDDKISWAAPLPHPILSSTGYMPGQPNMGEYGIFLGQVIPNTSEKWLSLSGKTIKPHYRCNIHEFEEAFPPDSIESIQVLRAAGWTTISGIIFQMHTDDPQTTWDYQVYPETAHTGSVGNSNPDYDPDGSRRFLRRVFPYLLGQFTATSYAGPEWPAIAPPFERYSKYYSVIWNVSSPFPPAMVKWGVDVTAQITDLVAPPARPAKPVKPPKLK
jgi:hypothetical protein